MTTSVRRGGPGPNGLARRLRSANHAVAVQALGCPACTSARRLPYPGPRCTRHVVDTTPRRPQLTELKPLNQTRKPDTKETHEHRH